MLKSVGVTTAVVRVFQRSFSSFSYPDLPIVKLDEDKYGANVIMPGYSYDDIDRMGNVPLWKVAKMNEAVRVQLYKHTEPYIGAELFKRGQVFLVTSQYEIFPGLYNERNYYSPINMHDAIVNTGRTSLVHRNYATSMKTGEPLSISHIRVVYVDKTTKMPTAIPEELKLVTQQAPIENVSSLVKPNDCYIVPYTVQHSDIDFYLHFNHAARIRMCLDAMASLVQLDTTAPLCGDIARYWVRSAKMIYQGENVAGDDLEICVWQNKEDPFVLHSLFEKEEQSVFQFTAMFADPDPDAPYN